MRNDNFRITEISRNNLLYNKMDPWLTDQTSEREDESLADFTHSFEDNFKPTVGDTLPDSKHYLEILGMYFSSRASIFNYDTYIIIHNHNFF